ncbi:MAG: RNA polymerase factor sigma-54 [Gammaproteobacteria bacterium]|nr:RNA polymerase factor sigma-54 [Gammaproteobacteria bacterium]MDJ0870713.1 RNA polymerase factor sigma-54 [Gammaproteobacteria bacterium]MDJ0890236.1 RNA polymerase factor sigma-54 [Gammaproteobacteria bacterium]
MKQSLQLRLGQHLTMTPQLQQAIRLLQLSTLELRTEVQEALDSNLMLELEEEGDVQEQREHGGNGADMPESAESTDPPVEAGSTSAEDTAPQDIPDELPVDSAWEDIYDGIPAPSSGHGGDTEGLEPESQRSPPTSLQDHLQWQLMLTPFSETDRAVATAIVDAINEDGYLTTSPEEIYQSLGENLELELDEVIAVLHRIQAFDPPGVGAQDLQESLAIQLRQLSPQTRWRQEAVDLVDNHLDLLGNRDYTQLMRRMKLSRDELREVVELIQSMNPRPGSQVSSAEPEFIVPDVFVRQRKGRWVVELNPEAMPRLRINPYYASLVRRADNSADNNTLRTHLQEARWFLKSLQSRSETLLKVATCIVERQRGFLEHGEEAMKPMVLHDIAEAVSMHESTISRVTTRKYMHTPRGIYELKFFFSSHVSTDSGGEASSTAIRALLKKLIAAESPAKPLSDSKLAAMLSQEGIKVARRTVAKYREAMAIPSSNERKRLA